ncbi:hypothetical protein B4O97_03570 [Marispirochaeta aestuarii]|uniref:Uncharacterized protein n=1 Tax=Marispirochaeta aestuarii TaxID=1963862 RepID=A0A1Y1S1A2_9SPIO|nr:hypothetical protein [Marispirochaeta aestuarii]ORC37282.1 hypothetical protein B4O97_03570 [Marispirochaeta aestuarii]
MSKETGGPAFPTPGDKGSDGMTLRDYFAAHALSGLMTSYATAKGTHEELEKATPAICYAMADAMLKEREK